MAPSDLIFHKLSEKDDISIFDCGHGDTNEYIKEDAIEYQNRDIAITYVLKDSNRVVGFISLAMGAIKVVGNPKLSIPGIEIKDYPALKIGRLGVDKNYSKKGFGTEFVSLAMALALEVKETVGCRFLAVDAYPNRIEWYKGRGFEPIFSKLKDRETMPMYARIGED